MSDLAAIRERSDALEAATGNPAVSLEAWTLRASYVANDVPVLLRAVDAVTAERDAALARLDAVAAIHKPTPHSWWDREECVDDGEPWPCPTYQAAFP